MRWFTLLLIGCVSVQATAADINVPGVNGPTIQAAINASVNGDEIIVAPGTYLEAIDFLGKAITVRSTDPTDIGVVMNTIIDGNGFFHVVQCVNGEGPDTVLSGFIITRGNANGTGFDSVGGGMLNNSSSPTVINCSFSQNTALNHGGGMYNDSGSPTVTNCSFRGNVSHFGSGGGMFNDSGSPTVTNCSFSDNTSSGNGGGMFNNSASPTVINCSFSGNTANAGGGMSNDASNPTVTNTGFCNNRPGTISGAYTDGGGNSLLYCPPPPIPVPPSCPADITGDTNVTVTDLLALLAAWGACP